MRFTQNPIGHQLFWKLKKIRDVIKSNNNSNYPPKYLQEFIGGGDFTSTGQIYVDAFKKYANIQSNFRVLDIGCGSGRIALPLTEVLKKGRYDGIDIFKDSIKWCNNNISKNTPNFFFHHVDVKNGTYNPGGKIKADDFIFPFGENTFDFCFGASLFTHMQPSAVKHYLNEIHRIVKPNKKCYFNFFIFNDKSINLIRSEKTQDSFLADSGDFLLQNSEIPDQAIAFNENFLKNVLMDCGFVIDSMYYGSFSGFSSHNPEQDFIIFHKE